MYHCRIKVIVGYRLIAIFSSSYFRTLIARESAKFSKSYRHMKLQHPKLSGPVLCSLKKRYDEVYGIIEDGE
jgi:hypothetical protein